ncbi:hypothetical protein AB0C51_13405, partial [Streptomyces pathocidini]
MGVHRHPLIGLAPAPVRARARESWAAYRWASGHGLDAVLTEADMPAGDFVRWCK